MPQPSDETKRKFLDALERKKNGGSGTNHLDSKAKVDQPHGPADHKREFRRKSG